MERDPNRLRTQESGLKSETLSLEVERLLYSSWMLLNATRTESFCMTEKATKIVNSKMAPTSKEWQGVLEAGLDGWQARARSWELWVESCRRRINAKRGWQNTSYTNHKNYDLRTRFFFLSFFSPVLWSRWTVNHPQEDFCQIWLTYYRGK